VWTAGDQRQLDENGAVRVCAVVEAGGINAIRKAFPVPSGRPGLRLNNTSGIIGELLDDNGPLGALACEILGVTARPVRAVMFDKSADANWTVAWHQDRTIAVSRKVKAFGFDNWTVKDGIQHVEPPYELIERMVTLRLHLDDCGEDNGPLHTVAGSHILGRLSNADTKSAAQQGNIQRHFARAGDVLVMRTSIVHASPAAIRPQRRRVLHIDFSADELPAPLEWAFGT
jgi:hypothetical protein